MLIGATLATLSWAALYFTPHQYSKLLWVCIIINLFMMATSTVVGGYMVETAQATSGSGRLTSVRNFVEQSCYIITALRPAFLASIAFGWTTVACGSVMFLVVPATVLFLQEQRKKTDSKTLLNNAGKQLVKIANAKTMWAAAGFMALFYCAPGIATAVFYKQQNDLHLTTQGQGFWCFERVVRRPSCNFVWRPCQPPFHSPDAARVVPGVGTAANLGYLFYSSVGCRAVDRKLQRLRLYAG